MIFKKIVKKLENKHLSLKYVPRSNEIFGEGIRTGYAIKCLRMASGGLK